jgi:hypothetical protein
METPKVALILLLTGCQEFTSAAHANVIDSDSGYSVSVQDGHPNPMVIHTDTTVQRESTVSHGPATDAGNEEPHPVVSDAMVDAPQGKADARTEPSDGGQVPTEPETGPTPPSYCVASACPKSSFGEPGCCRNSITCGVVFVGQSHDCIAYR